ncbi:uncharacterized protein LOC111618791 [Centruroides sculpturatus]|uniref:uncharacterized protein LOC111616968 n=1 Tax=Centruroides sculpturatus TaxID=218467 RepID=UPI000C6E28A9|nr:uncharacterized protein LOC111616968 [Centruroides sculpturatus]XP_023216129.1 uncharacterized protein LOC111618791 [Centruroides sculpturatus]
MKDKRTKTLYSSTLKPVLLSLRIVGVHVPKDIWFCRYSDGIWSLSIMLFRFLYLGQELTSVILGLSPTHLLDQIAVILATISACLASAFLAHDVSNMSRVLDQLDNTLQNLAWKQQNLRSVSHQILILTTIGWVYILLRWISMLLILDNMPEHHFQSIFFGIVPNNLSTTAIYVFVSVIWSMEIFFIHGAIVFIPILFMSFCILLRKSYREHNNIINELNSLPILVTDFSSIRSFHEKLCSIVAKVDTIFGKIVFFWYLFLLVTVCLDITQLFTDETLLKNEAKNDVFYFSLRVLYSMLSFLGTCITASGVSLEAHAALPTVHNLTLHRLRLDMDNKLEAQFLISRLTAPTIGLSGWNFFTINRSFILQVTAALTTYVVIVIQLNPQAMRVIQHLVDQSVNSTNNATATE